MIDSISIQNFQSHKDSKLEFSPGVNAIIGPSDSGKTAIIRALRWLVWNRPQGDAFRSSWGGDTQVSLTLDGSVIERHKSKTKNGYILNGSEYEAIGTEVPDEIKTVLNLNEINLQSQLDRPFLLDSSPGEVAKHFNKVAHLDIIDKSSQVVQKWIRSIDQDIAAGRQNLAELRHQLERYAYLEELENEIASLEKLDKSRQIHIENSRALQQLIENIVQTEGELAKNEAIAEGEQLVNQVLDLTKRRNEMQEKIDELKRLIQQIDSIDNQIQQYGEYEELEKTVLDILPLYRQRDKIIEGKNNLKRLTEEIVSTNGKLKDIEAVLKQRQIEFEKNFPDVCPLCGQERKA